jgi:hypothetical protein
MSEIIRISKEDGGWLRGRLMYFGEFEGVPVVSVQIEDGASSIRARIGNVHPDDLKRLADRSEDFRRLVDRFTESKD